ncbi:hypothetical protein [Salinicoccus sp. YB14-2]|uniref:DoxX family protein n=1 Tax=Salinicoccus sp. YB14-2 TaxID=1572701 RepID=UPI000A99504B|nr:hypothetical protein [Salinicoccus sp. YB14-2]
MIRIFMGTLFTTAGTAHFLSPDRFAKIIPGFIPFKKFLALFSGALELIFGVLLLTNKVKNWQITGMQAFLWAVFPANIYMATHQEKLGLQHLPKWALILRLPLQWPMAKMLGQIKK